MAESEARWAANMMEVEKNSALAAGRFSPYLAILRAFWRSATPSASPLSSLLTNEDRAALITVLDEFLMATPRHRILPLPLQPMAMTVHQEKIVIIGSSPLTLNVAEFFASMRLHSFPNLLLLTEDNLEADFSPNVVNIAPPSWGQMEVGRRKRLSLQSVVNIVVGRVTGLDRDNQRIMTVE